MSRLTALFLASTILVICTVARPARASATDAIAPFSEVYGTASDGTVLHWTVYTPSGSGPWPAVLVIHGGNFYGGTPSSSAASVTCAQDLANAGYIAFSIEYRLAPPGRLSGQNSSGQFPDQTDDVKLAVRTARADARCNGQVGAVGGSAGGSHAAFVATTGRIGDDRIDVGVCLSGAYDISDFSPTPNLNNYTNSVTGYVGVSSGDSAALRAASPAWVADRSASPLLMVNSIEDSMPYSQIADMIMHLDALGVTNYTALSLPGNTHSFDNWASVKDEAIAFLAGAFAGVPPPPPLPSPAPGSAFHKLVNISTRADVGSGETVLVGGFIITGSSDKRVVLRALGPSLAQAGISGALADPVLDLYDSTGILVESNDNRPEIPGLANPLLPANPSESLLTAVLPLGSYTAVLHGAGTLSGTGLFELYDVDPVSSSVANISTRGHIGTPSEFIIGGFIVGGASPTRVILRALGPSLAAQGVLSPLPDPVLEVHDANGALLEANDNWQSTQEAEIVASSIPPPNDREAAVVATLPPGNYTVVVRDATFSTGVALVEAYDLEPQ